MGRPDIEFRRSTLREIFNRWNTYAEFMGYKKPAEIIEVYDEEGMM